MTSRARPSRGSLVPNPAWVTDALTAAWESITAKVKPQWLPKLEDVHSSRGHVVGDLHEYGCGAYGCVYPTFDPGIVLKVTTDETEAEFAAYLSKDLAAPICTTYRLVMSLPTEHEGRRIYLLWRESAEDVGGIKEGSPADLVIYDQHKAAEAAYTLIFEGDTGPALHAALAKWRLAVTTMMVLGGDELRFVAGGMLKVFDQQGIFFGDIHAGNLGRVARNGKPTWVISDPGHVAVVGEHAEAREHLAVHQADDGGRAKTRRASVGSKVATLRGNPKFTGDPREEFRHLIQGDGTVALDVAQDFALEHVLDLTWISITETRPNEALDAQEGSFDLGAGTRVWWRVASYHVSGEWVPSFAVWLHSSQPYSTLADPDHYVVFGGMTNKNLPKGMGPGYWGTRDYARANAAMMAWQLCYAVKSLPSSAALTHNVREQLAGLIVEAPPFEPRQLFGLEQDLIENPHQEGLGTWKAPQIFADTVNARMLRLLWERGSMTQAEFMQRYHKVGERRPSRMTEGNTAFLNNLGRYVRGHSLMRSDFLPDQEGIQIRGRTISTQGGDAYKRSNLLREQAVRYLKPIERRMAGLPIDKMAYAARGEIKREHGVRPVTLHWIGPTAEEWLSALTVPELDKAYQSMDRVATESGDPLDATWLARLHAEVVKRGGGTVDHRPIGNPAAKTPEDLDTLVATLLLDPAPGSLDAIQDACLEHGRFVDVLAGVGQRLWAKHYEFMTRRGVPADINEKAEQWLLQYADLETDATRDIEDPAGHFDNAEDVAFARTADAGNVWPWCNVRVIAMYGDYIGDDYLGACSYESQESFEMPGGYYDDMKREAVLQLIAAMPEALVKEIASRVVAGRFKLGEQRMVEWYILSAAQDMTHDGRELRVRRILWEYRIPMGHWHDRHTKLSDTELAGSREATAWAWIALQPLRDGKTVEDTKREVDDAHDVTEHAMKRIYALR